MTRADSLRSSVHSATDENLRSAARQVAEEFGLRLVVLFGSAASNRRHANDLDIAVLADGRTDAVALTNRLIQILGIQEIDVSDLRCADALHLALVARDGVPLFEAERSAFASFRSIAYRRYADTKKFREAEHEYLRRFLAKVPDHR